MNTKAQNRSAVFQSTFFFFFFKTLLQRLGWEAAAMHLYALTVELEAAVQLNALSINTGSRGKQ